MNFKNLQKVELTPQNWDGSVFTDFENCDDIVIRDLKISAGGKNQKILFLKDCKSLRILGCELGETSSDVLYVDGGLEELQIIGSVFHEVRIAGLTHPDCIQFYPIKPVKYLVIRDVIFRGTSHQLTAGLGAYVTDIANVKTYGCGVFYLSIYTKALIRNSEFYGGLTLSAKTKEALTVIEGLKVNFFKAVGDKTNYQINSSVVNKAWDCIGLDWNDCKLLPEPIEYKPVEEPPVEEPPVEEPPVEEPPVSGMVQIPREKLEELKRLVDDLTLSL